MAKNSFSVSTVVYVGGGSDIDAHAHCHGVSDPGHHHAIWGGGGGGGGGGGSDGMGACGAYAHGISDPGHSHGLDQFTLVMDEADRLTEFTRLMTQAIAQSLTLPQESQSPANYLACDNAFVVRDIDQRFIWQDDSR